MAEIALAPEVIAHVGKLQITNTILATALADAILLSFVFAVRKNLSEVPGKLQAIAEGAVSYFYETTEQISGKYANTIFPWFGSFFIFIFTLNITGLLPGVGTVGFFEYRDGHEVFVPLLRAATSDFNTTFALAVVSLGATHFYAIKFNGLVGYIKKFLSFNPIFLFVGILELVSEFTKII
jgi:F-type H+-transporting ATPase subunit a